MPTPPEFCVVVIDALEMRRAGIAALLKPWAIALNALVVSQGPDDLGSGLPEGVRSIFVLFSVGGMSLKSKQVHDWVGAIRTELPDVPCIVLSDRTDPEEAVTAARMGLSAFIATSIDPQVALQAFALVINGGTYFPRDALLQAWEPHHRASPDSAESSSLTPRQSQVLQSLRMGSPNKLIARDLSMRESTVKVHVREILRKLGARNRTEAALFAGRKGIHRTAIAPPSDERP